MGQLDDRVVIVTGGGRGLGRTHCLELARHGATVVINDLGAGLHGEDDADDPAHSVRAEIEAMGGRAMTDGASVADWGAMEALVKRTVDTYGRLDAVVNNAGITRDRMLTGMSEADVDLVLAVHLKGTFALTIHACNHWRALAKGGHDSTGRIVNTTSGSGLFGAVGQANYGAAKSAIASLTVITAMEMGRYNVTANAVSPIAATRMTEGLPGHEQPAAGGWYPKDPGNTSAVVAWLCSDDSAWLSGAVLRIDGDKVMRVTNWTIDQQSTLASAAGQALTFDDLAQLRERWAPPAG